MSEIKYHPNRRIYKYEIPVEDRVELEVPEGTALLRVGVQDGKLMLWALVDTKTTLRENLVLYVVGTGNPLPVLAKVYVGTVDMGRFVWHVFAGDE